MPGIYVFVGVDPTYSKITRKRLHAACANVDYYSKRFEGTRELNCISRGSALHLLSITTQVLLLERNLLGPLAAHCGAVCADMAHVSNLGGCSTYTPRCPEM